MTDSISLYPRRIRGHNLYELDRDLGRLMTRLHPDAAAAWNDTLADFGAWCGGPADEEAAYTDRFAPPGLATYDADGEIINHIIYNPAWEACSRQVYARGIVGLNYGDAPAPFLVTFAMGYLLSQANVSLHCPVTMTGALAYVIDHFAPEAVRGRFLYDLIRRDGKARTGGTWATELHGGSDIGATTTTATPIAGEDGAFRLTGLKWFTSNANGGLALATARPDPAVEGSRGLGIYLVPTELADGSPNPMRIRRLKDKLGTVGIATGEIDLMDTWGMEVAPPPKGFKLMMEALEFSRIHNAMAAAGVTRRAFLEAASFALYREAFGKTITAYPMVQHEIMRILAPQYAGMQLAFAAANAFDDAAGIDIDATDEPRRVWLRLVTALAKYHTAEVAVRAASRAIEIIGGNGYVNDRITPRLLRDAQVLTVWEGPANIQALELLRLLGGRLGGFPMFLEQMKALLRAGPVANDAAGTDIAAVAEALYDNCRAAAGVIAKGESLATRHARRLLDLMADTMAAGLLVSAAAADWRETGDRRTACIARFFLEECVEPPPRRGIAETEDWLAPVFDDIIHCRPIT